MDKTRKTDIRKLLRNRNYVLFWFASAFSMASSNIIQFVLAIYILEQTGSATIFAGTLSVIIFPRLFLTPIAGVIGDRYSRIRLMQLFTALGTVTLLLFYRLSLNGLKLFEIFFLVIALELIEVFYQAPESALVPELVPDALLNEAVSVSKIDDGLVMVLSPAIGSLCYKAFGLSGGLLGAFCLNALSLCLLFPIHPPFMTLQKASAPIKESFQSGLGVLKENRFLRTLTILAPVQNFFFSALFSVSITHLLLHVYGVSENLFAAYRAVSASMVICVPPLVIPLVKKVPAEKILPRSALLISMALLGIGSTILLGGTPKGQTLYGIVIVITLFDCLSVAAMMPANMALMVKLQETIPDSHRSRVLSIFRMCAMISIPLGELFYGFLSDAAPPFFPPLVASAGVFFCSVGFRKLFAAP